VLLFVVITVSVYRFRLKISERRITEDYYVLINDSLITAEKEHPGFTLREADQFLQSRISDYEEKLSERCDQHYKTELISWLPSNIVFRMTYAGHDRKFNTQDDHASIWDISEPHPGMSY